ncbi:hypothetical protein AGDE_00499 [Angomonas deanei]|nr:hypothetical protein AGDE_00499 [Angomonas deanei]|eukprot:EPY43422.1 hypothetical protein AGDE_00499 [Angomonas deanei]
MKSWEKYIESHLLSEGESVETFRSRKNNSGFIEKQQFQQKAEWNEFIQEASLQEKQRSLELSRATRRGEK